MASISPVVMVARFACGGIFFDFSEELTADEKTLLSQLESSKSEGQKRLVQKILRYIGVRNTERSDE